MKAIINTMIKPRNIKEMLDKIREGSTGLGNYVSLGNNGSATLDGDFTIKELRTIINILKCPFNNDVHGCIEKVNLNGV